MSNLYTLGDIKDSLAIVGFLAFFILSYVLKQNTFILLMRSFCIIGFVVDFTFVVYFLNHISLRKKYSKINIKYSIVYIILVILASCVIFIIN